jgi:membrane protease YdiL (CAAX protease family)
MVVLFRAPPQYFVDVTFLSTSCMLASAYAAGAWTGVNKPGPLAVGAGSVSAAIIYAVFLAGNAAISSLHPFGFGPSEASSVYSLIAKSNPLYVQTGVLLFDAGGYEGFFRGVLQARLEGGLGVGAAPLVAALDSAIHILTLNPLWVATTFVADLGWGLTYHYTRRLSASFISHLIWDAAIFIAFPIR